MGKKRNLTKQILDLKSQGRKNIEISQILECSTDTVHYHLNPEYQKRKKDNRTAKRRNIKLRLVNKLGGKCCVCGYNKCQQALQFHHLNPSDKNFEISSNYVENIDRLEEEIKKCILVCGNCHSEIEAGITLLPQ